MLNFKILGLNAADLSWLQMFNFDSKKKGGGGGGWLFVYIKSELTLKRRD